MKNNIPDITLWKVAFFLSFFLVILLVFFYIIEPTLVTNPKITYKGLNESQINDIENMLNDIKPLYLNSARAITFYNESYDLHSIFGEKAGGINQFNFIRIKWYDDMQWNKQVICHELSHDFTKVEKYSYDLMETKFCFKDRNLIEVNFE